MLSNWTKSLAVVVFVTLGTAACGPEQQEQVEQQEQGAGEMVLGEFTVDENGQVNQEVVVVDPSTCWNGGPCAATNGYFDELFLSSGRARGWVCNHNYPTTAFSVYIQKYVPDAYGNWAWRDIGAGSASVYRGDVAAACGGNPYHGFDFYGVNTAVGGSTSGSYRMVANAQGMLGIARNPTYIRQ